MDKNSLHFIASQPESLRNEEWEHRFFNALVSGSLELIHNEPQMGPDNWPYMFAKSSPSAQEPSRNLIYWLTQKGIGLAVNPHKDAPDYVFSYGMLWNFRERAQFISPSPSDKETFEELKAATQPQLENPKEETLPSYARDILRQFFKDQGFEAIEFGQWINSPEPGTHIAFSLSSLGNPPPAEHEGILKALSWFLPNHYNLYLFKDDPTLTYTQL